MSQKTIVITSEIRAILSVSVLEVYCATLKLFRHWDQNSDTKIITSVT